MYLRKSTASQARTIGPFIDSTDFISPKTALTIANTDVKLMKNGGAAVNKNSGGGSHLVNGDYSFTFNATDTDTTGELEVSINVATALVVKRRYWVLEAVVYDAIYASSAPGYIQPSDLAVIGSGTAQAGAAGTITLAAGTSFADNLINGATVYVVSGTGAGQSRVIHAWDNTTKIASISPNWTTNPDATSVYKLVATPPAGTSSLPDVNTAKFGGTTVTGRDVGASVLLSNGTGTGQITLTSGNVTVGTNNDKSNYALSAAGVDAVWDEILSGHLGAGSTGAALQAAGSAGDPWSTPLPGTYANGTAGNIIGNRVNTTISSRAQPSDIPSATSVAAAVWATIIESTYSATQLMRGFASALLGKASGLPTNPAYRDMADTKDRIVASTDTNGNRTSVTRDLS